MAIPPKPSPAQDQVRPVFQPGHGVILPRPVAVPRKPILTTKGAAAPSNQLVAAATGAASVSGYSLGNLSSYTVTVPINFKLPLTTTLPVNLILGAPAVTLPQGVTLSALSVVPIVRRAGGTTLTSANITDVTTVASVGAQVTFSWNGQILTTSVVTIQVSGSLVTA